MRGMLARIATPWARAGGRTSGPGTRAEPEQEPQEMPEARATPFPHLHDVARYPLDTPERHVQHVADVVIVRTVQRAAPE